MTKRPLAAWFLHVRLDGLRTASLIAVAVSERAARQQARKRLSSGAIIYDVSLIKYSHAWVIDFHSRLQHSLSEEKP